MLLNRSTASRDSAIDIEKTSQKGEPEQERPNRGVVKSAKSFLVGAILQNDKNM